MNQARIDAISKQLNSALNITDLRIEDDSAAHAGHAGARDGRGHFNVFIVSDDFLNKPLIQRHRMVYKVLSDLLETDIHALSIDAKTVKEASQ